MPCPTYALEDGILARLRERNMSFIGACSVDAGIRTASAPETHGLKTHPIDPLTEMHITVVALYTGLDGLRVLSILRHIKDRDQRF